MACGILIVSFYENLLCDFFFFFFQYLFIHLSIKLGDEDWATKFLLVLHSFHPPAQLPGFNLFWHFYYFTFFKRNSSLFLFLFFLIQSNIVHELLCCVFIFLQFNISNSNKYMQCFCFLMHAELLSCFYPCKAFILFLCMFMLFVYMPVFIVNCIF